jgi:hypothetical protein
MFANPASIFTPSPFAAGPNEALWIPFSILVCIHYSMTRLVPVVPSIVLVVDFKLT